MPSKFASVLEYGDRPVLLEDQTRRIVKANQQALKCIGSIGKGWNLSRFQEFFAFYGGGSSLCCSRRTGVLYSFRNESKKVNSQEYKEITLTPLGKIHDSYMLKSYLMMAEKLVHQFRSPLTGVDGYMKLLMDQTSAGPEGIYLAKMEQGLNQTFDLMDQIERFAAPVTVENSTFKLDSLFLSMLEEVDESVQDKISIEPSGNTGEEHEVHTDYYLLRSILIELLKNALEANRQASGNKVTLTFHPEGSIRVRNRLPDISALDLERMFLPFHSSKAQQMGLGLPMCQMYCHKLNLNIDVMLDTEQFGSEQEDILVQISGDALTRRR